MNKIIPALAATIIAGALALSGASVASALDVTPITPGGTSSPSTSTSSANTPAATLPSTTPLKASAASGQSSSAVVSVPLTVKPTSSSSPTAVPLALPAVSPVVSPAVSPSKITASSKLIVVEVPRLALWEKPATTFGPQHLIASKSTADLNALDADAMPGRCYQADLYHEGDITGALLEGGVLYAPNNPLEDLLPGGAGVAYKTWCVPAPTPVIPTPVTGVTGSKKVECDLHKVTTTTITTTSNLFHLVGKVLVADPNVVKTVTTVRDTFASECPPVIVTPPVVTPPVAVTPPVVVTPVVAAAVVPVRKALAFTGPTPLADATQLALLLAGIIFLGAGIPMTIALRKRARRQ